MARGTKPVFLGITDEMRDGVYKANSSGFFTKHSIARATELQVSINRMRNTWDQWVAAKAELKAARADWQTKFNLYKSASGTGPTVATQLAELRKAQADLLAQQGEAFKSGDMKAAQTAFNAYTETSSKISEIDASTKNKDVTPEESAKSAAQKIWKEKQTQEATARTAFLSTLAHALAQGTTLDEKAQKELARLVKEAPVGIVPAYSEADGVVSGEHFAANVIADDEDSSEAIEKAETADNAVKAETPPSAGEGGTDA